MNISFEGKNVFLTGSSKGIGKEIKNRFNENGANVISPLRDELDLSDSDSVKKYIEKNKDLNIDIFIHCAGLNLLAGIENIDKTILEDVYNVNVFSSIELLKAFVPYMKNNEYGKIVFISSLYSVISRENRIAYSSSKSALIGLTRTLALELAPFNILVNSVAPGYVFTEMTQNNLSGREIEDIKKLIPTGRFQNAREIADAVCFLASDNNKSITGQQLIVDGGFVCR